MLECAQRRMASENGSPDRPQQKADEADVLNAGWRLRMVHAYNEARWPRSVDVLNAGWRLRMVHWAYQWELLRSRMVLNAGWRLRMVHTWEPIPMVPFEWCSTPDGV